MTSQPRALFAQALQGIGFVDSEDADDNPVVKLCEAAGLTLIEYEAVVMTAEGLRPRRVGQMSWPRKSEEAVRTAAHRGIVKLRRLLVSDAAEGRASV